MERKTYACDYCDGELKQEFILTLVLVEGASGWKYLGFPGWDENTAKYHFCGNECVGEWARIKFIRRGDE